MHTLVLSIRIHEGLGKQGGFGHICVFFNIERDGIIVEFVSFSPSVKILFSLDTIRLFILFTRGVFGGVGTPLNIPLPRPVRHPPPDIPRISLRSELQTRFLDHTNATKSTVFSYPIYRNCSPPYPEKFLVVLHAIEGPKTSRSVKDKCK